MEEQENNQHVSKVRSDQYVRVRAEYPFFSNLLLSRLNIHEDAAKAGKVGIPGVSLSNTNTVDP